MYNFLLEFLLFTYSFSEIRNIYQDVITGLSEVLAIKRGKAKFISDAVKNISNDETVVLFSKYISAPDLTSLELSQNPNIVGLIRETGYDGDNTFDLMKRTERPSMVITNVIAKISNGSRVILDGINGQLIVSPTPETVKKILQK